MNTTVTSDKKPGKFQVVAPPPKPPVNPAALEEFAAGATAVPVPSEAKPAAPLAVAPISTSADRTKGFLLRLKPEQFDRVEQVYAHSTFKSKQTMGEKLFMDAIEELAKKLGI